MPRLLLGIVLLVGALANGCLTPQQARKRDNENAALHSQIDSLRFEVERVRAALAKTELPALQAKESVRRTSADVELRMNQFAEQIRVLSDRVDDLDNRLTNLPNKLRVAAERIAAAPPPSSSTNEPATKETPAQDQPAVEKNSNASDRASGMEISKLYDTAYQDLARGQYDLAREGFAEFLRRFPQNTLADNAQYWVGESYYSQQQYARAAAEFAAVLKNYPAGDKMPAAMLKRAFALISLSKRSEARALLEQLSKKYPTTQEAELARARLKDL